MTGDSRSKPRGDRMTTDFFAEVLTEYLADDRIESGVLRLELEDGRTRRLVVDDDTESLSPYEYVQRELAETQHLLEENEDAFDDPVALSIPVDDEERVREELAEDGTVTTWIKPEGAALVLERLRAMTDTARDARPEPRE